MTSRQLRQCQELALKTSSGPRWQLKPNKQPTKFKNIAAAQFKIKKKPKKKQTKLTKFTTAVRSI